MYLGKKETEMGKFGDARLASYVLRLYERGITRVYARAFFFFVSWYDYLFLRGRFPIDITFPHLSLMGR